MMPTVGTCRSPKRKFWRRRSRAPTRFRKCSAFFAANVVALGIVVSNETRAQQQSASSTQQNTAASADSGNSADSENTGQDFTSPENLFQLRYQYKTAPGTGSTTGSIRTVTTDTVYLRSDYTLDLGSPWKVVVRADLPFVAKDPISADHPSGDYLYGLGDTDFQAAPTTSRAASGR